VQFPLSFWDISLWLAYMAIILLITSELISPHYERAYVIIEKKPLRITALVFGVLFMFTVLMHAFQ
jgi:uncharacterized membrane protein